MPSKMPVGAIIPRSRLQCPLLAGPGTKRLLLKDDQAMAGPLLRAAEQLAENNQHLIGSCDFYRTGPTSLDFFREAGWMIRADSQFHWRNRGLSQLLTIFWRHLSSRKRKAIRRERRKAQEAGRDYHAMFPAMISAPTHWDHFWQSSIRIPGRANGGRPISRARLLTCCMPENGREAAAHSGAGQDGTCRWRGRSECDRRRHSCTGAIGDAARDIPFSAF